MSETLPENSFSGVLKVLKLTSGEEIIGFVNDANSEKILIKLPAKMDNFETKDAEGNIIEYVKLTNYLCNIKSLEVFIPKNALIFIASPSIELEKMYEVYFLTMQTAPKSFVSYDENMDIGPEAGLHLLNNLFNNEDFVNFVNDLIENFENVEIITDDSELFELEGDISDPELEDLKTPPTPKKRPKMKPEKKSLPFKPDSDPKKPESWSDNPLDYL